MLGTSNGSGWLVGAKCPKSALNYCAKSKTRCDWGKMPSMVTFRRNIWPGFLQGIYFFFYFEA